jgi:hypothetical protein
LTLTIRVLLLLAGLLAAALLLAGLLTRILVLLARILILIRHRASPLLVVAGVNYEARIWLQGNSGSTMTIARRLLVMAAAPEPADKTTSVQDSRQGLVLLPPPVPTVRKWHDASFRLPGPSPRN